jgi:hypothetical protein
LLGQVFGRAYPDVTLRARPKATFAEVFWRRHTRSLVAGWAGAGIDPSVVDRDQLRQEWDRPRPDLCTAMLAQQIWLATTPRRRAAVNVTDQEVRDVTGFLDGCTAAGLLETAASHWGRPIAP